MRSPPPIGTTVTMRVASRLGPISLVGTLIAVGSDTWSVRRRDRSVSVITIADIEALRVVPPTRSQRASVDEVEQAAALGWRALTTERLGDWLLRAADGFTGRANSALPLGSPGADPETAIDRVTAWYADRGLTPRIQVPEPDLERPLLAELGRRGWQWSQPVAVLTGELSHLLRAAEARTGPTSEVSLSDRPDEAWLATYRQSRDRVPDAGRRVLTNHPMVLFASIRSGDAALAIARVTVDARWAGVFAVEVRPQARRRGLATAAVAAALREAGRRGARQVYLQVAADNAPALALYDGLNATEHHRYAYAIAPT